MKKSLIIKFIAAWAYFASATAAFSHISLETKRAPAGSTYKAVLQVGHGCDGSATTGLAVQIPPGFRGAKPMPKPGWTLTTKTARLAAPYDSHGKTVFEDVVLATWKTDSKKDALPDAHFDQFTLRGNLHEAPGPMWFKVLQTCGRKSNDWKQIPVSGTSTQGLDLPAAFLELTDGAGGPAGAAPSAAATATSDEPLDVQGAWVRTAVAGQQGTGAFMKITARSNVRLVGASSPVAVSAEVHEMKMEGDVMRMRAAGALELRAGQPLELKPGGYHLMLLGLKQPLTVGSTLALTLLLKDASGGDIRQTLLLPVSAVAPGPVPLPGRAGTGLHRH
jgi:periplasmic copper chaperone A